MSLYCGNLEPVWGVWGGKESVREDFQKKELASLEEEGREREFQAEAACTKA